MSNLIIEDKKLLDMWNFPKNNNINIETVTLGSYKKVWWKCDNGHEWEALICNMSKSKDCPYCTNRKVLKGYNDLATLNPTLIEEWNYNKNIDILPTEVSAHSGRKVWWKCSKCNHEWQATIDKRSNGRGCPKCKNKK